METDKETHKTIKHILQKLTNFEASNNKQIVKGLYTLDIFAHNIAIKRYCNKKIIFSHRFLLAKVSSELKVRYILF